MKVLTGVLLCSVFAGTKEHFHCLAFFGRVDLKFLVFPVDVEVY